MVNFNVTGVTNAGKIILGLYRGALVFNNSGLLKES